MATICDKSHADATGYTVDIDGDKSVLKRYFWHQVDCRDLEYPLMTRLAKYSNRGNTR